jgi:predicted amidohydrolase YtcJ
MKFLTGLTLASVFFISNFQSAVAAPTSGADTIFYGGTIVTVNPKNEEAQALAVKNGKIVAVGTKADVIKNWQSGDTKLIDLKGKTAMPGLIDPHIHTIMTAMGEYLWLDLSNFTTNYDTIQTLTAKLKARLKTLPKGQWLMAFGVDPSRTNPFMAELTADVLDKVTTEVPIFILNQSGHIAYVNHKAYEIAGVTESTPNPGDGGIYQKNAQGKLTGVLIEGAAYAAFLEKMPPPSDEALLGAVQKAAKMFASKGVTATTEITVGAMLGLDAEVKLLKAATATKDWPIRLRAYLYGPAIPKGYDSIKPNDGDDRLRFIGVKYVSDGSTQGLTAALESPYIYPKNTTFRGNLDYKDADIYSLIKPFYDQGWQISIHANGDRAIQQTLNNYEKLLTGNPNPQARRLRIEHFTINHPDQVKQAVKLGVVPGFTIGHVDFWGEQFRNQIIGPRAERIAPSASMIKAGGRFTYHSDSPISPVDPLHYISIGVDRLWQKPPREVLGPDERITIDDAIRAVTINAAYQIMSDDKIGSLEVGKQADLVILAKNPRIAKPEEIAKIKVKETWIDGKKQVW